MCDGDPLKNQAKQGLIITDEFLFTHVAELWQEYEFSIGNNKAARNFTSYKKNGQGSEFKVKYGRKSKDLGSAVLPTNQELYY
jgi:hypothetical protein